jgi:hypothetical protein
MKRMARVARPSMLWRTSAYRRLSFVADVPDDRFGEPNHKAFQPPVLAFKSVHNLLQLGIPLNLIGTMRPSPLQNDLLHCLFLRLGASINITTRKHGCREFGNSTDAANTALRR